jgi:hypothetical protein
MKMARGSLLALALCIAPAIAHAQLGIKGGLSYGNVSSSGVLPGNVDQRSGFAVGLTAISSGVVGFGLEALYAQRGVTSSVAGDSRHLDYIDVPLYLRVAIPAPISPFAYAGPQASYEIKCGADGTDCPDTGRPKFTFAGVIGAGIKFGAHSGLSLEGRYVYGLTDLKLGTVSSSDSYKTRAFMLLAGIGF